MFENVNLPTFLALAEVSAERRKQDERWGEQNHPDGTGAFSAKMGIWSFDPDKQKAWNDHYVETDTLNWSDILAEEVAEAFVEKDHVRLRAELIQVAAVAVAWIEHLDRQRA